MTDRELMQQALDVLEEINQLSVGEGAIPLPAEIDGAMDALRERLAQPEREPAAWNYYCEGCKDPVLTHARQEWASKYPHWREVPLYEEVS